LHREYSWEVGVDNVCKEAGDAFIALAFELALKGTPWNARHACTLSYYARLAGAQIDPKYGLRPDAPSGHYTRRMERALDITADDDTLYNLCAPGQSKYESSRAQLDFVVRPAHESIAMESTSDVALRTWQDKHDEHEWIPAYERHPLLQAMPHRMRRTALPFAIYMDMTPYNEVDSVLAITFVNIVTGMRHLICTLRKLDMCACGCRGWCGDSQDESSMPEWIT